MAETLGQFLFRGLIDDTARQVDVAARQRELQDQLLSEHRGRVLAYEHAASVPMTRVAGVNASINGIEQFVDEQFAKFLAVRLTRKPTKFSTTRLLRAHNLGLVQTERKFAPRPDGADADAIGRHIRMRDGYVCVLCRRLPRSSELHVHHIIPLSAFGTNDERNLATLCYACHCRQHPEFQVPRMKAGSGGAGATVNE